MGGQIDRHKDRQRDGDRQIERETDRQTDRQDGQSGTQRQADTYSHVDKKTNRQSQIVADRNAEMIIISLLKCIVYSALLIDEY